MNRGDGEARPHSLMRGRRLLTTWILIVNAAEFLGFAVPAVIGAVTADSAAGRWVTATASASGCAYLMGLAPSSGALCHLLGPT